MKDELNELKRIVKNYTSNIEYGSNVSRCEIEKRIELLEKLEKTTIISAFPACGKTFMFNNNKNLTILDSDSSEFSWVKDLKGVNTKERNPNFPSNYIKHIESNLGKVDIIFVSSHEVVRNALKENGLYYTLYYPNKELKHEWIRRFIKRGNNEGFINFIDKNWNRFIDDIELEGFSKKIKLNSGEYISDRLE